MTSSATPKTEIIAFCSGKGGTGKTLIASCLGYALRSGGHRVLMVDGDPGTDGLSLFLLGPRGMMQIDAFLPVNTFTGMLRNFAESHRVEFQPRTINRGDSQDHGMVYEALISGKRIYGEQDSVIAPVVPDLDRQSFRVAISRFFDQLRAGSEYDYVLVDTRGGFAFESTDICALANSFVVVTEPDYTSFYQDRNLIRHISSAAQELDARPLLRSIIVNKAIENQPQPGPLNLAEMEAPFRLVLTKEFPLSFQDTHPVPMDLEAIHAYKTQQMPYRTAPASHFAFATLSAFGDILKVVTAAWSEDRIAKWNALVDATSQAIARRNTAIEHERQDESKQKQELVDLRRLTQDQALQIESLKREIERVEKSYEREIQRTTQLYNAPQSRPYGGAVDAPSPVPAAVSSAPSPSRNFSKEGTGSRLEVPRETESTRLYTRVNSPYANESRQSSSPSSTEIAPPSAASEHSTLRSRRTRVATLAVAVLVAAGAVVAGLFYLPSRQAPQQRSAHQTVDPARQQDTTALLNEIYSPMQSPDLKVIYLKTLLSQNWHSLARIDLSDADLNGLNMQNVLLQSANLSRASLRNTNLAGADLRGADLTGAILDGADLRGANLEGARITTPQLALARIDSQTVLPNGRHADLRLLEREAAPRTSKSPSKK